LRGDVDKTAPRGDVKPEFFAIRFHWVYLVWWFEFKDDFTPSHPPLSHRQRGGNREHSRLAMKPEEVYLI
jgi:hypothetical protein